MIIHRRDNDRNLTMEQSQLVRVKDILNAECYYCPDAFSFDLKQTYDVLRNEVPWSHGNVVVFGKTFPERRLTCLFGDVAGGSYHYAGKEMIANKWHPLVAKIRDRVEVMCKEIGLSYHFDTCLCNYYRPKEEVMINGEWKPDYISWHADAEEDLVKGSPIASVSFGATRRFDLRPNVKGNKRKKAAPIQHPDVKTYLPSGSLFVMGKDTQTYYIHQVPEERKVEGGRINLTFRVTK